MKIRQLTKKDLQEAAKFCRMNMEFDSMPDFLFEEKTFLDNDFGPEMALIAEENDQTIGFMMGVVRPLQTGKCGYIKLMAVKSDRRREGIASKLYDVIHQKFIQLGCERERIYESHPNYLMPGIDPRYTEAICFVERKGFKKFGDTSNLLCDLVTQDFSTDKEEQKLIDYKLIVKRAESKDLEATLEFLRNDFAAWVPEVTRAFQNDPISVHICIHEGEVVGFSAYDTNNLNTGWFGPMGTSPTLRGKNIGGILLKRCLADQKAQGHQFAIIPWVGPIPFYMHYCNSKVQRVFWRYEKLLN